MRIQCGQDHGWRDDDTLQEQAIAEGVEFATWVLREGRVARRRRRWAYVERLLTALAGDAGVRSAEQLIASILRGERTTNIGFPVGARLEALQLAYRLLDEARADVARRERVHAGLEMPRC